MYPDIPIAPALAFVAVGLYVLAWSADRFVEGAEAVARALGVSPFIIGMVIVGFGTSAPELAVSALSGRAGRYRHSGTFRRLSSRETCPSWSFLRFPSEFLDSTSETHAHQAQSPVHAGSSGLLHSLPIWFFLSGKKRSWHDRWFVPPCRDAARGVRRCACRSGGRPAVA